MNFFLSYGISSPFVVPSDLCGDNKHRSRQSERLLPRQGMCQIAAWRGLQLQCLQGNWVFCQSAPSILCSQNNLNVVAQPCAISRSAQTCTFSALQIKACTALTQGCLGEGNAPLSSAGKTWEPATLLPEWGKIVKIQFYVCTFYYCMCSFSENSASR